MDLPVRFGLVPQTPATTVVLRLLRRALQRVFLPGTLSFVWLVAARNTTMREEVESVRGHDDVVHVRSPGDLVDTCQAAGMIPHRGPMTFPPDIITFHLEGGIGAVKLVNGENGVYTPRRLLNYDGVGYRQGQSRYDNILVSSNAAKQRVVKAVPDVEERVLVVGDLFADEVLGSMRARNTAYLDKQSQPWSPHRRLVRPSQDAIRRSLGIGESNDALLIQSSWGPSSTAAVVGPKLIEQAVGLTPKRTIIFEIHPGLWSSSERFAENWVPEAQSAAEQFPDQVIISGSPIRSVLAARKMMGDTSSSMSQYFALTGGDLIYVDKTERSTDPASPAAKMHNRGPVWKHDTERLATALERARPPDENLIAEIDSEPGRAAELIGTTFASRLGLEAALVSRARSLGEPILA